MWSKCSPKKPWLSQVWIPGKGQKYVGYFASEEEAARAHDIKARELLGDDALVNFFPDGSRNLKVKAHFSGRNHSRSGGLRSSSSSSSNAALTSVIYTLIIRPRANITVEVATIVAVEVLSRRPVTRRCCPVLQVRWT